MNINIPSTYGITARTVSVEGFVKDELIDQDCDDRIDSARACGSNAAEALGRLIDLLASRGDLTGSDVFYIVRGWRESSGVHLEETGA